jgi:hypothetical protein
MTLALIDVPRCLNVDAAYVGAPRVSSSGPDRVPVWSEALPRGGTPAFRTRAVEECLDTVAVLRAYREPLNAETWLTPAGSERRLLAQVNAMIALGPAALEQVRVLSLDGDVPDPGRVFASLFVLGCVEGRQWLEPALDIFLAAAVRNANEAAAAIEAASLCPNSGIAALLTPLLDDERSRVRASATRVLAFRGALSEAQWTDAMLDGDVAVVAAALAAPLQRYDRSACDRVLRPSLAEGSSEELARLAMRAGLSLGLDSAHARVRAIARSNPSWAGAAHLLALVGDLSDALVREMLERAEVMQGLQAAAVLGSLELVPDLLEVINRTDAPPEVGISARQALATITGLDFVAVENPTQALRLWSQHSPEFQSGQRYRHGRRWSLEVLLESLHTGPSARKRRQEVYFEMQAATQSPVPRFNAYDFVGVQVASLRDIERWLGDLRVPRDIPPRSR